MSPRTGSSRSTDLSLSADAQWTLHHVLLHRIEREQTSDHATDVDAPPLEVYQAFETLDDGESRFTHAQLEAVLDVLGEYQRCTDWWSAERAQIEGLLREVSRALEGRRVPQ